MPVLIPEDYVADLSVRLSLYRRLADLETDDEIDNFGAELRDRFGVLPDEVRYLFKIVAIKALLPPRQCREGRCRAEGRGASRSATTSSPIRTGWSASSASTARRRGCGRT